MLYIGEELGDGSEDSPEVDIAVDPLEGTNLCADGVSDALAVVAMAEHGQFLNAPDTYMDKIAVGEEAKGSIDIRKSPTWNLGAVAEAKRVRVPDLTAVILDRPRHAALIQEVRKAGVRIRLISDGDVGGALATTDPDGRPSARMVICRGFDAGAGWLVFYSDRPSRKGRALAVHPRAAIVFYWEPLQRQIRIEGPVTEAPAAPTEAYWRSRPLDARNAAIASDQSAPIASRAELLAKVAAVAARGDDDPPRPERWIGYRVWAEHVELWVSQPARM